MVLRCFWSTHICFWSKVEFLIRPSFQNISIIRKTTVFQSVSPHRYTMCHGVQSVRAKARRKLKCMSLRLAFYIRIELDRSNVDGRSFQAHPDKMLYFQRLYGFRRKHPIPLNFPETIENTRWTGFSCFAEDSSQTVVTLMLLTALEMQGKRDAILHIVLCFCVVTRSSRNLLEAACFCGLFSFRALKGHLHPKRF